METPNFDNFIENIKKQAIQELVDEGLCRIDKQGNMRWNKRGMIEARKTAEKYHCAIFLLNSKNIEESTTIEE